MTSRADISPALLRRIHWRILPLLMICYLLAQVDRLNVGFAQFGLRAAIGLDDLTYGRSVALFFAGYIVFEIPSNLFLQRFGARRTFCLLMCGWGITTTATMWVTDITEFNITRFLLGVFEAGFFPGVVLYLTYWYPPQRRAGVLSIFASALAISGVIVGPLSGWILQGLGGLAGLAGWQWLFLVEGLPAVLGGLLVFRILADTPVQAKWLQPDERDLMANVQESTKLAVPGAIFDLLLDPMTLLLSAVFFGAVGALYGLNFWLPVMIKDFGLQDPAMIGLTSALPYLAALVVTILWGRDSDRRGERRWHFALPALAAAVSILLIPWSNNGVIVPVMLLAIAMAGILSCIPIFWSITQDYYPPGTAPVGIATVNSVGVLAGALVPYTMGWLKTRNGGIASSLVLVAGLLVISAVTLLASHARLSAPKGS